ARGPAHASEDRHHAAEPVGRDRAVPGECGAHRRERGIPLMAVADLFSLKGKTALVTGGSRGLGVMIARGFLQAGGKAHISPRDARACAEAEALLNKSGTCIALPHDLGRTEEVKALAADIAAREESLDILINNAGAAWAEPIDQYSEKGWDKL